MWQDLERRIRNIASNRWNCNATTETIAGVKCDCVLKPQPDEWIIVEITEESSLEKSSYGYCQTSNGQTKSLYE